MKTIKLKDIPRTERPIVDILSTHFFEASMLTSHVFETGDRTAPLTYLALNEKGVVISKGIHVLSSNKPDNGGYTIVMFGKAFVFDVASKVLNTVEIGDVIVLV